MKRFIIFHLTKRKTKKKRTAKNIDELDKLLESSGFALTREHYGTFNEIKRVLDKDNLSTHVRAVWVMAIMATKK